MVGFKSLAATLAAGAGLLQAVSASLTPVTIKGNAFFNGTNGFYIRGVDYQPGRLEPLHGTAMT